MQCKAYFFVSQRKIKKRSAKNLSKNGVKEHNSHKI